MAEPPGRIKISAELKQYLLLSAHKKPGDTYFRAFGTIIGLKGLTTVFGMGTGVALSIYSPGRTSQRR